MTGLALALPDELLDEIARRAAAILAQDRKTPSPWLDVDEAAAYLRCRRQRIYDLTHAGALEPARDGRRLLFNVDHLDAYLLGRNTT